jgi:hypothetical protein
LASTHHLFVGVFFPASLVWFHVATTYICIYKYISWYIYIIHIYILYVGFKYHSFKSTYFKPIFEFTILETNVSFFPVFSTLGTTKYTWVSYGRRNPWVSQDQWPLTILNTRCLMAVCAFTSEFFGDHNHPLLLPLSTNWIWGKLKVTWVSMAFLGNFEWTLLTTY